jgi:hypothetical protein
MGRFDERNMGLPILGTLLRELLFLGYIILQIPQMKTWDPERMKAAIKAIRNREMGSYKASRFFKVPQTTLERYVKDQQKSSSETVKTKLGMKQVLRCEAENDLAEHCLLIEKKFFGLTMADVVRLAYQRAVRNEIKNRFCKRDGKAGTKWLKNLLRRHPQISVRTPEGLSPSRARGFTPESVAPFFFKSTNPQWTSFNIILQDFTTATKPTSLLYSTNARKY